LESRLVDTTSRLLWETAGDIRQQQAKVQLMEENLVTLRQIIVHKAIEEARSVPGGAMPGEKSLPTLS